MSVSVSALALTDIYVRGSFVSFSYTNSDTFCIQNRHSFVYEKFYNSYEYGT